MKATHITESEWVVMQALWTEAPLTAAEVANAIADRSEWSDRTVKTLLARLVKKGALAYEVDGKRYLYKPVVSREACIDAEGRSLADRAFDGATSPLLIHFVERSDLSAEEIAVLKRILAEKESQL